MKPHIKCVGPEWMCRGKDMASFWLAGYGKTPKEAYNCWRTRKNDHIRSGIRRMADGMCATFPIGMVDDKAGER